MTFICQLNQRACQCDPQAADEKLRPCGLAKRGAKLARLAMGSEFEPEAVSAFLALRRLFTDEKVPTHFVGMAIENGEIEERRYSDADARVIYERGLKKGRAEQQNGDLEFFTADGQPRWYEMAVHCQRNAGRLRSPWEKEFIADIAGKVLEREPSHKQAQCILRIFVKLGGYCDPKVKAVYF
jgi:hypothetical protein